MRLEADPAVSTFCERPARLTPEPAARLVDFWRQGAEGEEMLLLDPAELGHADLPRLTVFPCAQCRRRTRGGQRLGCQLADMLPAINATQGLLPPELLASVVRRDWQLCFAPRKQLELVATIERQHDGRLRPSSRQQIPGLQLSNAADKALPAVRVRQGRSAPASHGYIRHRLRKEFDRERRQRQRQPKQHLQPAQSAAFRSGWSGPARSKRRAAMTTGFDKP